MLSFERAKKCVLRRTAADWFHAHLRQLAINQLLTLHKAYKHFPPQDIKRQEEGFYNFVALTPCSSLLEIFSL